jgi:hypothetical protein
MFSAYSFSLFDEAFVKGAGAETRNLLMLNFLKAGDGKSER